MYIYHLVECTQIGAERRDLEEEIYASFRCLAIYNSILSDPTSKLAIKMYCIFSILIRLRGE